MQLNELTRFTKNKKSVRVGRGGKRGKTSGRGTKGQKSRAGTSMRPELRDIIKKLPKNRGYKFKSFEIKPALVNLALLEKTFTAGDAVNPETLIAKKVVKKVAGRVPKVKILATGKLTKKIVLSGCLYSETAKASIEAAGGSVA